MSIDHFVGIDLTRFKAFEAFSVELRSFNILVGPNNAGKSTILAAFRILAAAMRRAWARQAEMVHGPEGVTRGYKIDLSAISVAEENIFHNYDEDYSASIRFRLSNKNTLTLYFPEQGVCYLLPDAQGRSCYNPTAFRREFNCSIAFVPILGPVDHKEQLFGKEAARLALFNYTAARNFRNIWYHFPEKFNEFRESIQRTWPGMDILPAEVDHSHEKPRLFMFCPEKRRPREIFWAGFGFQVWCQMLTHIIQGKEASLFLIDEPDIYLHSDLQRQLLGILRSLGPDVLIATHSTEIITEAETDDIVVINKDKPRGRRIRNPAQMDEVFRLLGSNVNPILTQLAKTRKVLFVEGKDFQLFGRLARKLGYTAVGNRTDFAVVAVEGFNPERIKNLKAGMEETLGVKVSAAAILDRDYRSDAECAQIKNDCEKFCDFVAIHRRKEIENFLLVPKAIDRAAAVRAADRERRTGTKIDFQPVAGAKLQEFSEDIKNYVTGQYLAFKWRFEKGGGDPGYQERINEEMLSELDEIWNSTDGGLNIIPGKEALSSINSELQDKYKINVTITGIIDAMRVDEVPSEVKGLVEQLHKFSGSKK